MVFFVVRFQCFHLCLLHGPGISPIAKGKIKLNSYIVVDSNDEQSDS